VYVDDFKMAGPSATISEAWNRVRKHIKTEVPTPAGKYLGCQHTVLERQIKDCEHPRHPAVTPDVLSASGRQRQKDLDELKPPKGQKGNVTIRCMQYDMADFFKSCVDRYLELAKIPSSKLHFVETPFLDESKIDTSEAGATSSLT
jgi:hypothetical protein